MIKKYLWITLLFTSFSQPFYGQDSTSIPRSEGYPRPAESEIESVEPVDFTNFVGENAQNDSLEDIIGIGSYLSKNIVDGRSSYAGKYELYHIIATEPSAAYSADIINLNTTVGVNHIRNLRHIIAGFLSAQYSMSYEEAILIAEFVTYYNAAYRGDIGYIDEHYSRAVSEVLEADKLGLATDYSEWPGASQIIIPIATQELLGLDPRPEYNEIGNESIVDLMEEEQGDRSLDKREKLVDLRNGELTRQQDRLDQLELELNNQNRDIVEQRETALINNDMEQALELQEDLVNNRREQNDLTTKQQEIAQNKEDIRQEENALQARRIEATNMNIIQVYFPVVEYINGEATITDILAANIGESLILKHMPKQQKLIGTKLFETANGRLLGATKEGSKTKLALLNPTTLKIIGIGTDSIDEQGRIWIFPDLGGYLSFVEGEEDEWHLGLFNENLRLELLSDTTVNPAGEPILIDGELLVQNINNGLSVLDPRNMAEIKRLS